MKFYDWKSSYIMSKTVFFFCGFYHICEEKKKTHCKIKQEGWVDIQGWKKSELIPPQTAELSNNGLILVVVG